MDMQGTPIGTTGTGMKNTSDPSRYDNPIRESAGPVAADSLAAESTKSGGGFAQNRNAQPLGVSGSSSTFNDIDTSSATKLEVAPDAEARESTEAWKEETKGVAGTKYPEGLGGQGDFPGQHSAARYAGRSTSSKQSRSEGTAPGYISSQFIADAKPKGKNLQEGGFDSNAQNASFGSDIGTKNDPGRVAESKFQRDNMQSGYDAAGGPRQKGVSGDSQYDILKEEQQL
ncbi:MAG: hypothetical protein M1834_002203 [Cirrosporium novae-zelandiae]|nr:MAG: hypothetical protein M1834_002203 [Cirrosporium novae-zelandiae]